MLIGMLGGLTFPSLNALMSHGIPKSSQGELQGAVASLFSLTTIIGPVMMTQLFGFFTSPAAPFQFPGAAFVFAAFLTLLGLILFARAGILPGEKVEQEANSPREVEPQEATSVPEPQA
jgi:DHA1 family tetracycline resistance protein-like MFS transporter